MKNKAAPFFTAVINQKMLQNLLVGFVLIFFALVVLQQADPLHTNMGRDSGIYTYVSSFFLKGGLPYSSAWETKPPGIFYIDAFALWTGGGTRWGIWLVEFVFLFLAAAAGYYFLYAQFGIAPGLIGSILWLLGLNLTLDGGNLTEEYSLVFGFAALLLWSLSWNKKQPHWFYAGIGICTGLSVLLRPNNAGPQFSIIIVITLLSLFRRDYSGMLRDLAIIGLSSLLPLAAAGLHFYFKGAFTGFLEAGFLYNFSYTSGKLDIRGAFWGGVNSLGLSSGIALVGYFIALKQVWAEYPEKKFTPILLWAVIDGLMEVFLSAVSGRNYQHYFMCWLPLIGFSSAFLTHSVFGDFSRFCNAYPAWFASVVAILGLLLFPGVPGTYSENITHLLFRRNEGVQKRDLLVEYVNSQTDPEDFVLVWGGQAGINFLSKRDAPTPYIFYPLFVPSKITERMSAEYYAQIQHAPPELIVDGSYFTPADVVSLDEANPQKWAQENSVYLNPYVIDVLKFIREHYHLKKLVNGIPVYRLNP